MPAMKYLLWEWGGWSLEKFIFLFCLPTDPMFAYFLPKKHKIS